MNESTPPISIATLILAAGESRRLGQPKQLLPWGSQTLLRHTLSQLAARDHSSIFVALGAYREEITADLKQSTIPFVPLVINEWHRGQGFTLKFALQLILEKTPHTTHVLVTLCDQPYIPGAHYQALKEVSLKAPHYLAATQYPDGLPGVPCLFPREYWTQLSQIQDQQGARSFLRQTQEPIVLIPCPEASSDIDTPADIP